MSIWKLLYSFSSTSRSLEDLKPIEPKAREVYGRYLDDLEGVDVRDLAIHRRSAS